MLSLQDSVGKLKGVGPKMGENLASLDILTVEDLLTYFPSRYDEITPINLEDAKDKQRITVKGTVISEPMMSRFGYRRSRLSFRIMVGQGVAQVTFFNQPYLAKSVQINTDVTVMGTWDQSRNEIKGTKLLTSNPNEEKGITS